MKNFLGKLNARKLGLIAKIAMPIGIALLILAIWGFVKSSHVSMSGKNGASATLIFVHLRWFALVLGVGSLCGGFWLLKKRRLPPKTTRKLKIMKKTTRWIFSNNR